MFRSFDWIHWTYWSTEAQPFLVITHYGTQLFCFFYRDINSMNASFCMFLNAIYCFSSSEMKHLWNDLKPKLKCFTTDVTLESLIDRKCRNQINNHEELNTVIGPQAFTLQCAVFFWYLLRTYIPWYDPTIICTPHMFKASSKVKMTHFLSRYLLTQLIRNLSFLR